MSFRSEPSEFGQGSSAGNAEYLRALKQGNESRKPSAGISSSPVVAQNPAGPGSNRRKNPRYKCEGSVEFRTEGIEVRTWATLTDISRGGCYVEMQATSPPGTHVNMVIDLKGVRIRVKGTVRISYPLLGMGIFFTDISKEDGAQLDELLLRMERGVMLPDRQAEPSEAGPSPQDLVIVRDSGIALDAVAKFFQTNHLLSREEFTELIGKSQAYDPTRRPK